VEHTRKNKGEIWEVIQQEWKQAETQHRRGGLEEHAKGIGLIGIWSNKQVQKIISLLTRGMRWTEEQAMYRAVDLARINMKGAVEVFKELKINRQGKC